MVVGMVLELVLAHGPPLGRVVRGEWGVHLVVGVNCAHGPGV